MLNLEPILQAIGTTGFPIAACCALFYLYDKTLNSVTTTLKELTELLRDLKDKIDKDERGEDK